MDTERQELRKRAAYKRSPLLRTFIAPPNFVDRPMWYMPFMHEVRNCAETLGNKYGKDTLVKISELSAIISENSPVLQETCLEANRQPVVIFLLMIGYQIGDDQDIALFTKVLLEQFQALKMINSKDDNSLLEKSIESILKGGAKLADKPTQEKEEVLSGDAPKVFKDFINSLED